MKQQKLNEIRNYQANPRSYHEQPDPDHRCDICFEGQVSLTKQSEAEAADINNIMKRYEQTGLLPANANQKEMFYGDFSTAETFQEALAIVSHAQSAFHRLPAEVRANFQNDPQRFLEFVESAEKNPEAMKELVNMGLATERPKPAPTPEPTPAPKAAKPSLKASKIKTED